jgi:CHAT domain-containing protein/tetratricopeptide (TPR) repeat protein
VTRRRRLGSLVIGANLVVMAGLTATVVAAPSVADAGLADALRRARDLRDARAVEEAHHVLSAALAGLGTAALEAEGGLADALLHLADLDLDLWRVDAASERLAEAERRRQSAPSGATSPLDGVTRSLEVRARIARVKGDYVEALRLWEQALTERRRSPVPDAPRLLQALAATAEAHWFNGGAAQAEALFAEALALAEALPGPDQVAIGRALKDVGLLAETRGDLEAAEAAYRRSLELIRDAWGSKHPALAPRWISVGNLAVLREDLLTADAAYEEAASILDPLMDRSLASDKAALALNWGALDARLGRADRAREQLERARSLWTETRGPDHPHLAWVSESVADVLADAGRLEEAGEALADARARRDRSTPGAPVAILTTARLAALRAQAGHSDEARAFLRVAESQARRLRKSGPFFEAHFSARRAEAYEALGDLSSAARFRARAETLLARQLRPDHPGVADARGQRARVAWRSGQRRLALRLAADAWRARREALSETAASLPESDALTYVEQSREFRDLMLCAAAGAPGTLSPSDVVAMQDELGASRAIVSAGGARSPSRPPTDEPDSLRTARRRYATLVWQPVATLAADYAEMLARAQRDLAVERRLARAAGASAREENSQVRRPVLGPHDALVSFGRYRCPATRGASPDAGYLASVRVGRGQVRVVRFLDGAALDRAIDDWYAAITAAVHAPPTEAQDEEVDARGRVLTKALWAPLAAAVGPAERVFIVPDGKLHSVSWYALPTTPGSYLIDEPRVLHVLTAESDLNLPAADESRERSVVVMADPQLESAAQTADASALRAACRFVDPLRLPRLGEARAEARQLEALARAAGRPVLLATGEAASEGWLRAHAPRAGILHLAAHGGVLSPESCREPAATAAEPAAARVRSLWAEAVRARPLMRSGLLLTGAARFTPLDAPGSDDDGVLVAEEAARLDLRGAQWVVLSACSTRRGPVVDAEGALGLHRAFHRAGARTVIASLWDVQDAPARRFMDALYGARLRGGRSTADAMRDAERAVLAQLRKDGRSTHPVQWAAFVASGDWR